MDSTLLEGRLGLTHKKPSYRATGIHPSPRSVLVWRSANRSTSLPSTNRPTLCTHWSLTGNTAPAHWVATRGRRWWVPRPLYKSTVTRKASMLWFTSYFSKARIGIIGNEGSDGCSSCDSRIGFGTGGFHDDSNTCGNEANYSPDNGNKHLKAMRYILVKWEQTEKKV